MVLIGSWALVIYLYSPIGPVKRVFGNNAWFVPCQAFGVFGLCQIHAFVDYVRSKLSRSQFDLLFRSMVILLTVGVAVAGGALTFLGSK